MDFFAVTIRELKTFLATLPDETAHVVVTPPSGESFPLLGWTYSPTSHVLILTGAEGAYDTEPEQT